MKPVMRFFAFSNLSIKQRLPLLIFSILLVFIICFSWVSYLGVRNASLVIGRERISTLSDQLSTMFQQSLGSLATATNATASQETVKKFLLSEATVGRPEAIKDLEKLRQDSLSVYVELVTLKKNSVLSSSKSGLTVHENFDSVLPSSPAAGFTNVGKIFVVGDSMYYPVIATVSNENKPIGYVIRWRLLTATPRAIEQIGQLIGANSALYFGNDDGKFWTNLIKPVPIPPINMKDIHRVAQYTRQQGNPLLASAQKIPNSRWLVLIEFSQKPILEAAQLFLRWVIVIGFAFATAGSFITWLLSRNITKPLKKLTAAATEIAAGNYGAPVKIVRNDELGTLAEAFNSMAVQIQTAHQDLEKKVQDRTAELERMNKEMESFSYSVSHDLHAPVRIIRSYVSLLSKKAADKLDEESTVILDKIMARAALMGVLIDELLKLSYLDRKELTMEMVDMEALVRSEIDDQLLLRTAPVNISVKLLLPVKCDSTLIRQVWSNLISNALKYSAKKERPCIEINSVRTKDEIIYSIEDNGVGFDMKYRDKLFRVFQRMHGKTEFEGNGVGLALVQRVVVKHGGRVWAKAEEGEGAVFYFSLPAE